jgi:multidrug resistance protein, MATE family
VIRSLPSIDDLRALLRLAIPIVIVQVGIMLMGVVDTIIVGHVSARELAAAALGHLYFFALSIVGMGTLMAVDPIVSQAIGAGDHDGAARGIQRGVVLAIAIGIPAMLLCIPAGPVLGLLRRPAEVVPRAAGFAHASIAGMIPFFLFVVLRQSLQAMKRTRAILITIVVANLVNAGLNWVFVFGNLGAPALGAVGSAWSSTIGRWVMLGMLLALSRRELGPYLRPFRRESLSWGPLGRMLRIGFPIGIQFGLEFGAFATIALLAGWLGTEAMAGHQIAINLASLTFMVPLGVGSASAVLVGHAVGEGDAPHARRVAVTALVVGAGFMAASAVVLLAIPEVFARLYTSVPGVVIVAATLIPIAGLFQVFDGIQVVAAGILRGIGDTRVPLIVNLLGFWLVGMPVSLWIGFQMKGGVAGLWWGFVAGLAAVAVFLVLRVRARLGGDLARLHVEQPRTVA